MPISEVITGLVRLDTSEEFSPRAIPEPWSTVSSESGPWSEIANLQVSITENREISVESVPGTDYYYG